MKHDWVRVHSPVNPVFRCRRCGDRHTWRRLGPRKGKRMLYRADFEIGYRVRVRMPPCGHPATMKQITTELKKVFTPAVLEEAVEQGRAIFWNGKRVNLCRS